MAAGTALGEQREHAVGDELELQIFNKPEAWDSGDLEEVEYDGEAVDLDEQGSFLFYLGEAAMTKALLEIEKTLPAKANTFVAAKGGKRLTSGKRKLSSDGRACMAKLKPLLESAP